MVSLQTVSIMLCWQWLKKKETVKGDVNSDGAFNAADIVMMQKCLLCAGNLTDWKAGDLFEDNIIDSFDLCLMRKLLIQ